MFNPETLPPPQWGDHGYHPLDGLDRKVTSWRWRMVQVAGAIVAAFVVTVLGIIFAAWYLDALGW